MPRIVDDADRLVQFHGNVPAWLNAELEERWVGVGKPWKDRSHLIIDCLLLMKDIEAVLAPVNEAVKNQTIRELIAVARARWDPKAAGGKGKGIRVEIKTA